ncbi:hypothetical protein NQ317_005202 [Molorchus minor]|uniref:Alpha-SNAP n=1 Tax=Molorchus minor TaxID=1323400 RepID=A0ABQ9JPT7_9CUCU|nr:hypothetical protein NQ317_005202 [Molorchus minor]
MAHIELKAQQLLKRRAELRNPPNTIRELETFSKWPRTGLRRGVPFADAADLNNRSDNYVEAAINYVEAANCFKRCDISKAVDYFIKAINIYCEKGKFVMAAKYHQAIAELLEDEDDREDAVSHYEKAAGLFKQECNFSSANKCLEKIAEYSALSSDYHKAINIFQEIACFDLASSVLRYCAKHYLFCASICLLCSEVDISAKLQTYVNMYPAFEDSREYHLIQCLAGCIEHNDADGFTMAVKKYDSLSKLSQWHVTMLLRAKKQIREYPDLR